MAIERGKFGTVEGKQIEYFILRNKNGIEAKVINFGATLVSLLVPGRKGTLDYSKFDDIVLGYDDAESYLNDKCSMGCTVGRYANRIANAKFTLDGKEYNLTKNTGENHIHGGEKGFGKVVWDVSEFDGKKVVFKYLSRDGEEGYPGNLETTVIYSLTDDNELKIEYAAVTDKPTIVNLTNHSYFNLGGHNVENAYSHMVQHMIKINSDYNTESDNNLIPTGKIIKVENTKYDFREPISIGRKMERGYDNNFILNKQSPGELSLAAKVFHSKSERLMEIHTTEPAIQFYTGNFLDGVKGKGGAVYNRQSAFCLETQHYPDSPNHAEFPSTVLKPGETYRQLTVHKFSINQNYKF